MRLVRVVASMAFIICAALSFGQDEVPKTIAESVSMPLSFAETQFLAVAEAMPEEKYGFIPTGGNFEGARSFAEQVKHVACAQFAFYNQIEGKKPPEACERGGPSKAKTKAELAQYLKESFEYGNKVLATIKLVRTQSLEWASSRFGTSPITTASSSRICG